MDEAGVAIGRPVEAPGGAHHRTASNAPPLAVAAAPGLRPLAEGLVVGQQMHMSMAQQRLHDQAEIITLTSQARALYPTSSSPWVCLCL